MMEYLIVLIFLSIVIIIHLFLPKSLGYISLMLVFSWRTVFGQSYIDW